MFHYNAEALKKQSIRRIWLQYYVKEWAPQHNVRFSVEHGLKIRPVDINPYEIGTYLRYFQLDGSLLEVNQLFKYIKFGFGQCTDHACYDIHAGIITREQGIKLVRELDGKCADRYIQKFCDYIEITIGEFWRVANSFRGKMWEKNKNGEWKIKNPIWEQETFRDDIDIRQIMHKANFEI